MHKYIVLFILIIGKSFFMLLCHRLLNVVEDKRSHINFSQALDMSGKTKTETGKKNCL